MLLIADNLQLTSMVVARAVESRNPRPVQDLVRSYESAGAEAIDINTGPLIRHPEEIMAFLVEAIQEVSDLPILLDTANPAAIKAGLEANKKKAVINGFSLEPAKRAGILPLARKFEADIIGYLLLPDGQVPAGAADRLTIAVELYNAFKEAGLDDGRLIVDPVVVPLLWANGTAQAPEVLSVLRTLPDLLGFPVKTVAGLSNLTAGKGPQQAKLLAERTYLAMLAAAGLDMVLLNISHRETVQTACACAALTARGIFTWAELA